MHPEVKKRMNINRILSTQALTHSTNHPPRPTTPSHTTNTHKQADRLTLTNTTKRHNPESRPIIHKQLIPIPPLPH